MASMDSLVKVRLTFKQATLLTLRLKLAALIIRFGCWVGGGHVGDIEVGE